MSNRNRYVFPLALFFSLLLSFFSCDQNGQLSLKPIQVQIYALYDSEKVDLQNPFIHRIFYDPFVLNINVTNVFSMSQKDISDIQIKTNDQKYFVSFQLKKRLYPHFFRFTSYNTNTLVAVMVDGKVKTIAKIEKPIPNGNFMLVAKNSQTEHLRKFLSLFFL